MLRQFYHKDMLEVGIDEAGRGCLLGPVCVAAVIWPNDEPDNTYEIKDSKKISEKKRYELRDYIIDNAISYSVQFVSIEEIDKYNILQATIRGMHRCIDQIRETIEIDTLLIDGDRFKTYMNHDFETVPHYCIVNGDNTYKSIAAASILAKTFRDDYIKDLVKMNTELEKYGLLTNKGYGTKIHKEALKLYGQTEYHRKSFKM